MKTGPIKKPGFLAESRVWEKCLREEVLPGALQNPALRNKNAVIGLDGNRPVLNGK